MAFEFRDEDIPATRVRRAAGTVVLGEGDRFRLGWGDPIVAKLDATVPAGKRWRVSMTIRVEQTDA